ncbi:MAG: 3-deoxy-D-manno-octulosonic acid transferase, partial [Planctomycetes bacterium]|nr:3-deoxy-D-manno-octulosonic acid transferase [Planctomycetota bacterium]
FPALRTFYLPFDFSWLAEKALHRLRPTALMLVELELWPNLLAAAYRRHIPVLVANGRIMPRSAKAYRFLKTLFPRFARAMAAATYCAQNEEYAQRLQALGVPRSRTHIAGNVKFDGLRTAADSQRLRSLVEAFAIRAEDRVLVAGSTWPGEERILLNVYKELRQQFDNLRLVLVPRHIERAGEVEKQIEDAGFKCYRRTSLSSEAVGANGLRQGVVLVDTVGELATVYALATCVFVGKSLVPLGGQNMMEPAALGKPVLFGPHTFNFKREVELLLRHEAAQVVGTEQELLQGLKALLSDSERAAHMARRAQKVIVTNQGATGRHMEVLKKVLESAHGG